MVKKMWALVVDYGTNKEIESVSNNKEIETIMANNITSVKSEVKPVWVCDRDPFENVRTLLAGGVRKVTAYKIYKAIQKDIKNFDEEQSK